jgi:streptomycin 6-kinase
LIVPTTLAENCEKTAERSAWLRRLPAVVGDLATRWSLEIHPPFDGTDGGAAWVAPATRADGSAAVLKLGMPHMEGEHEIAGLRFWSADPTVQLLEHDESLGAMLLERCEPGTSLRDLFEPAQDIIIAALLRRLWRKPPRNAPFRDLDVMTSHWHDATFADAERWPDAPLVRAGLQCFQELIRTTTTSVLLATDLHAGNVLRAQREPWLVIDPKPFLGDPAYDATQHLLNCRTRLLAEPEEIIRRFAELLGVDHERVRLWTFARAAAEPREQWDDELLAIARATAP